MQGLHFYIDLDVVGSSSKDGMLPLLNRHIGKRTPTSSTAAVLALPLCNVSASAFLQFIIHGQKHYFCMLFVCCITLMHHQWGAVLLHQPAMAAQAVHMLAEIRLKPNITSKTAPDIRMLHC
jgi:hypothetical protein